MRSVTVASVGGVERRRVLGEWGGVAGVVPGVGGVHELVSGVAVGCGGATAVVCGGVRVSYAELEVRANRLAQFLRGVGVGAESVVGLCFAGGVDVVVGMLGVWKAGARICRWIRGFRRSGWRSCWLIAGCRWWWGRRRCWVICRLGGCGWWRWGIRVWWGRRGGSGVAVVGDQLAYVMYTSGSTGVPKGVGVTHRGLVNYVASVPGVVGCGERGRRWALLQPVVTDLGNTVVFGCLASGGELHLVDPGVVTDPGVVAGYLAAERIDYVKVVPSHLAALGAGAGGLAGSMPGRALVLGGEGAGAAWVGEVLAAAAGRGCVVANHYGPTESTIGVVAGVLAAGDVAGGVVAVGAAGG